MANPESNVQTALTLEEIRNLLERYAVIHAFFVPFVRYESERLFPSGQNSDANYFAAMSAKTMLSELSEFRQEVPHNLAVLVEDSIAMIERMAACALGHDIQPRQKVRPSEETNILMHDILVLTEQYAELEFAYSQLIDVRYGDINTKIERKKAAELGLAIRQFKRQVPDYLHRVVRDRLLEMEEKLAKVSSRTKKVAVQMLASGDNGRNIGYN